MMEELKKYTTAQIVSELISRESVEEIIAESYEVLNVKIEGPAIILIVTD